MRFALLDHPERLLGLPHTWQKTPSSSISLPRATSILFLHASHSNQIVFSPRPGIVSYRGRCGGEPDKTQCLHGVYILVVGSLLLDVSPAGKISPSLLHLLTRKSPSKRITERVAWVAWPSACPVLCSPSCCCCCCCMVHGACTSVLSAGLGAAGGLLGLVSWRMRRLCETSSKSPPWVRRALS